MYVAVLHHEHGKPAHEFADMESINVDLSGMEYGHEKATITL